MAEPQILKSMWIEFPDHEADVNHSGEFTGKFSFGSEKEAVESPGLDGGRKSSVPGLSENKLETTYRPKDAALRAYFLTCYNAGILIPVVVRRKKDFPTSVENPKFTLSFYLMTAPPEGGEHGKPSQSDWSFRIQTAISRYESDLGDPILIGE